MKRGFVKALLIVTLGVGPVACETKTQSGALIGGVGGAGVSAAIGSASGNAGKGALIGGAAGVLGGALIGNGMDRSDKKKAEQEQAARRSDERHYAAAPARVTRQDVVRWSDQGISDEVIIDRIERSDAIFRLTAKDENTLRDDGVSEDVIEAMKYTLRSRSTRAE